jgi:uncharacterized protein
MIHSYSFSNFRSFRSRVEISLELNDKDRVHGWDAIAATGERLTTAMAILGANASGKTSLLQPLAFLAWFVPHSFGEKPDAPIPVAPHFASQDQPVEFELTLDALEPDTVWRYALAVTTERVMSESLERKRAGGRWRKIFDRRWTEAGYVVDQFEFGLDSERAISVRQNVSLISWAVQFDVPLAKQLVEIQIISNINSTGRFVPRPDQISRLAQFYAESPALQNQINELLRRWDLGLEEVIAREIKIPDRTGKSEAEKIWLLFCIHRLEDQKFVLPFFEESSGTRQAFTLLAQFLPALENGGIVVFDELDSDLHPMMIEPLLRLFSDPKINLGKAQILFSCHATEVLRYLQKSQVTLVEKNELESRAQRLDSITGVRIDDNRVAKYLSGAYGAIPRIDK